MKDGKKGAWTANRSGHRKGGLTALSACCILSCSTDVVVETDDDAPAANASSTGATGQGGIGGGTAVGGNGGEGPCPVGLPGPDMVPVDDFCIDSTEVTNAQYAEFLQASPSVSDQPTYCWSPGGPGTQNDSFVPTQEWPAPGKEDHPVVWVHWCDAYMYCLWAEKRLCGAIGGGHADFGTVDDACTDATSCQWYRACSFAGTRAYPYGSVYEPDRCNGSDFGVGATLSVGSIAGCEGGYPGVLDMSGNVYEMEDACNDYDGFSDSCRARGGGFLSPFQLGPEEPLSCGPYTILIGRDTSNDHTGFRCCWP